MTTNTKEQVGSFEGRVLRGTLLHRKHEREEWFSVIGKKVRELRDSGMSQGEIAFHLNENGYTTLNGRLFDQPRISKIMHSQHFTRRGLDD